MHPRARLASHAPLLPLWIVVASLVPAGCVGQKAEPDTSPPDEPMPDASVSADSHFAAGQFHESAVVTEAGGRPTREQIRHARRDAVRQYEKALDIDPEHRDSLFRLAVLATEDRDLDRATGFWQRYVKASGGAPAAWRNLAVSLELLGDPEEAELAYRNALAGEPEDETSRVNLGMLLARSGRLSEARAELAMVLPPASVHHHVAQALARCGRGEEAAAEMRAATAIDPRYASATLHVAPID